MIAAKFDARTLTAALRGCFRRMRDLTGARPRDVIRAEAGVILKTWAGRTKVATAASITRAERLRAIRSLGYTGSKRSKERGEVTVNSGYRPAPYGRIWIKVREPSSVRKNWLLARGANFSAPSGPGAFRPKKSSRRGTAQIWAANVMDAEQDVRAAISRRLPLARRSAGLGRQSVVQIADALGIDLAAVQGGGTLSSAGLAKARAAIASNGRSYTNGTANTGGDDIRPYIDLFNRYPRGIAAGMDSTLLGVIAGRVNYFAQNYRRAVFTSQSAIARAYPNLIAVSGSN